MARGACLASTPDCFWTVSSRTVPRGLKPLEAGRPPLVPQAPVRRHLSDHQARGVPRHRPFGGEFLGARAVWSSKPQVCPDGNGSAGASRAVKAAAGPHTNGRCLDCGFNRQRNRAPAKQSASSRVVPLNPAQRRGVGGEGGAGVKVGPAREGRDLPALQVFCFWVGERSAVEGSGFENVQVSPRRREASTSQQALVLARELLGRRTVVFQRPLEQATPKGADCDGAEDARRSTGKVCHTKLGKGPTDGHQVVLGLP